MDSRTCRCGCGTPLRSPFTEFAPGHHLRVARHEGPRGSALPVRATQIVPCLHCGREITFVPGHGLGRYCSVAHRAADQLKLKPQTGNALQLRCFRYMTTHGLGVAPFCRAAGVNANTFRDWIKHKGRSASRPMLAALARLLGITEEQALTEAGGVTVEERQRESARRLEALRPWQLAHTPEAKAKRSASLTGLVKTAETREKLRAAWRRPERVAAARERLRDWHMRTTGQALAHLGRLLRSEPTPGHDVRREWEERIARELGERPEVIRAIWQRTFERRGLVKPAGGRPPRENRHRIVDQFMAERGVTPWSQKPRGFWDQACRRLEERAPADAIEGPALRAWYALHIKVCRASYLAPRGATRK